MKSNLLLLLFFSFFSLLTLQVLRIDARQGNALNDLMKLKRKKMISETSTSHLFDEQLKKSDERVLLLPQTGSKEGDWIDKLPGQLGKVDFQQYGGYVTVDAKAGRALYYYFAEAVGSNHSSKPLLLWLNGGPGCSSFGIGGMGELGPFRVKRDGKTLFRNPYGWNNVANVLFLESPAGVGFSYSNTTSDYGLSGDSRTAKDAYVFLVNWLERFPEYKSRDFYISGESYAGHYVPQLAHTILQYNELLNKTVINLKGITIGNGLLDDETQAMGVFDYLWTHAIISDETIGKIHKYCDFSPNAKDYPKECDDAVDVASSNAFVIDLYNIYAPLCFSSNLTNPPKKASIVHFDPCTHFYIDAYLNTPQVQEALHANTTKLNHPWSYCSQVITAWRDSPTTILPLLEEFMVKGIRVWVFSGDMDAVVPITSTRYSLNNLKLAVKIPWKPWYVNQEVGGYQVVYKGDLTLATVRGAGHQVPSYQPMRALTLIDYFLQGKPLPSS